jgi:hypothetical protein
MALLSLVDYGRANSNPILNLRLDEVVFHDRHHVGKLLITFNLNTVLPQLLLKLILIGN